MKNKNSVVATILVLCFSLCISAQIGGGAYNDIQQNIVLAATVGESDFKPYETRMLAKGKWRIKAIMPVGTPINRLAWASWNSISNETDWNGKDCDQSKRGYNTDFYVSIVGIDPTYHWSELFTSARCRTQPIAVKNAMEREIDVKANSLVTFFLPAFYEAANRPLGGGLVLSLVKQRQPQQQQQVKKTRSKIVRVER